MPSCAYASVQSKSVQQRTKEVIGLVLGAIFRVQEPLDKREIYLLHPFLRHLDCTKHFYTAGQHASKILSYDYDISKAHPATHNGTLGK